MSAYVARHRALPAPGRAGRVATNVTRGVVALWFTGVVGYVGVLVVTA